MSQTLEQARQQLRNRETFPLKPLYVVPSVTRVVSMSGGLGSFMAAKLTVERYGAANTRLVFCDTKTEDPDLYRFLDDACAYLKLPLTTLADGRNLWEVFTDQRFMSNSRVDQCSQILKRGLFRRWLAGEYRTDQCEIIFGIDRREAHRMSAIAANSLPWAVAAPLCETDLTREDILDVLDAAGIEPPHLYELGFPHNNCGGFCVKTGQRQMKLLLDKLPERYQYHEEQQEKLFNVIGNHGFIRKVEHGTVTYLSLREFREHVQAGGETDGYPEEGCGCFV